MGYTLEDLKPQSNRFYSKHHKPKAEIKELEEIRERYLEKKIKYLSAKTNTSSQNQTERS